MAARRARAAIRRWRRRAINSEAAEALARLAGWRLAVVVGDSHARVFDEVRRQRLLRRTWFNVLAVSGATARGLANPNSTTDALTRFAVALDAVPRSRLIIVMLGEVDCGFLCWYLADQHHTTVAAQLEISWQRHRAYLEGLLSVGRTRLCVVSVVPPTVEDYTTWAGLDTQRRHVTADLEARTALTRAYNAELRAWSIRNGCGYLDLDSATIDPATGVLRDEYRNPDPFDHHLNPAPLAALVAHRFAQLDGPTGPAV